ncbi:hypothetical protein ACLBWX_22510 [Methylobacterium sp. M6A4_1b]
MSVTKQVYGSGADFPNLAAAMAWLATRRIVPGGAVTFMFETGQFVHDTIAASMVIQHPDLNWVSIIGATLVNGGFPVYANMAMTGSSGAQRTADLLSNLTLARNRFPTELRFTGSASIQVVGNLRLPQDVLLTADLSPVSGLSFTGGTSTLNRVACASFGSHGLFLRTTLLTVQGGLWCFGNSGSGVYTGAGATLKYTTGSVYGIGNGSSGITANEASTITTENAGLSIVGSGNVAYGASALSNSFIGMGTAGAAAANGSHGIAALNHSSITANSASASTNGGFGIYAGQTSFVNATGTTGSGNTGGAFGATQGSFIDATGYGMSGAFSPVVNTSGNGNSFIQA